MAEPRIACVIPARAGSKRIKSKNTKHLGGKELVRWSIDAAVESGAFNAGVWVTSDSEEILWLAMAHRATPIERPAALAEDHVSAHAPVTHAVGIIEASNGPLDYVCLQQPTSPFVRAESFAAMAKLMVETTRPGVCGAVAVPHKQHMIAYDREPLVMRPILGEFSDPRHHLPTEPHLVGKVCPYFMRAELARDSWPVTSVRDLLGYKLSMFEGFDIDTPEEWEMAEIMAARLALVTA